MRRVLAFSVAVLLAASSSVAQVLSLRGSAVLPSAPGAISVPSFAPPPSLAPSAAPLSVSLSPALAPRAAAAAAAARSVPVPGAPASLAAPALSAYFDGSASRAASVDESPRAAVPAAAPPSREDFPRLIAELMSGRRAELEALSAAYARAAPDEKKALDARIQAVVDELNVLRIPPGKSEADLEAAPPDFFSDDFAASPDYPRYRDDAESRLLAGEYIPQFVFAGAATRLLQDFEEVLGRKLDPLPYRMYGLDLWDVVRRMRALDDAALLKLFQGQKIADPAGMVARLKAVEIPEDAQSLGMGPRQIVAYRTLLESLARRAGLEPSRVLARQRLVLHVNEEIAESVLADFEKNGFYGFDRARTVFIIQPIFKGYRLDDAGVSPAADSPALPFGHGYASTQLNLPDAFVLGPRGEPRALARPFLDEAIAADRKGRFVLATHRINDATKFAPDRVVDLDGLALSLSLLDQGYGITVDLVGNPGKQKGGSSIRFNGDRRSFLLETSNAKGSPRLSALLDGAAETGSPYNAFRLTSTPAAYKRLLDDGLRYNLRFKGGFFYLESVTGDLTRNPASNSVAVQKRGELIHDFKQLANLLDALEFVRKQDGVR